MNNIIKNVSYRLVIILVGYPLALLLVLLMALIATIIMGIIVVACVVLAPFYILFFNINEDEMNLSWRKTPLKKGTNMRVKVIGGEHNVGKEAVIVGWDFSQEVNYYNLEFMNEDGSKELDDGYAEHELEFLNLPIKD